MPKQTKRKKSPPRKPTMKGALVKGYLERKPREGFEFFFGNYRDIIGNSSGVYALYKGKNLYYVGIAQNLLNRVWWHLRDKHKSKWDNVSFFVIDKHRFSKDIETMILRITDPKGNGTRGKFEKHFELQDQLNAVSRDIKKLAKLV